MLGGCVWDGFYPLKPPWYACVCDLRRNGDDVFVCATYGVFLNGGFFSFFLFPFFLPVYESI